MAGGAQDDVRRTTPGSCTANATADGTAAANGVRDGTIAGSESSIPTTRAWVPQLAACRKTLVLTVPAQQAGRPPTRRLRREVLGQARQCFLQGLVGWPARMGVRHRYR